MSLLIWSLPSSLTTAPSPLHLTHSLCSTHTGPLSVLNIQNFSCLRAFVLAVLFSGNSLPINSHEAPSLRSLCNFHHLRRPSLMTPVSTYSFVLFSFLTSVYHYLINMFIYLLIVFSLFWLSIEASQTTPKLSVLKQHQSFYYL